MIVDIIMQAPTSLLQRFSTFSGLDQCDMRLFVILSQLGDFDSLEYATALAALIPKLTNARIGLAAIGIGDNDGANRFCKFTGFPREYLEVDQEPKLHKELGLYEGLRIVSYPWPNLILMCAGVGSSGTLAEVLRGYTGDRSAPPLIEDDQIIRVPFLPPIKGAVFSGLGRDYQRPFELATIRLRNMIEVLSNWRIYVPKDEHICQRGGTFLLNSDDEVVYQHIDPGILGFSETMAKPLTFLDPYL